MSFLIWTFPWTFWYYKKITLYNKLTYTCTLIGYFLWFFRGWHIDDITMNDLANNKTNRFHGVLCQFSKKPQKMAKCDKNLLCQFFLFLPHFGVICDLLLHRSMAPWNLFVEWKTLHTLPVRCYKVSWHLHMISKLAVSRNIQNFFASLLWCPIGDQVK